MSIELSPTARELIRSTFFGKDFDSHRQEIIDAIQAIFGDDVASNITASEQGVMLIELNAYALGTASWYGDRQADDTTLDFVRLRRHAVAIARQLGYKATSSVPAVVDVRVQLLTIPPVQLTIPKGTKASGPDGLIFETLSDLVFDQGQIGAGLPVGLTINEFAIDPVSPSIIYAGTSDGILKTLTSGSSWFSSSSGITFPNITTLVIDPGTPTTLYAGTVASGIFKSIDSGASWTSSSVGLSNLNITSIAIDPITPTILYVGTNAGGLFKTINSGSSWSQINIGITDFAIQTVVIDPVTPSIIYAGAFSGGIFKTISSGLSWTAANLGLSATNVTHIAVDPVTPTTLYAATTIGGVHKSIDSAATWVPANVGLTATSPNRITIDGVTPSTLYVSTIDAGVYKTIDSGANWAAAVVGLTNTNNTAITVDPVTPTTLYVGATDGGIFVSLTSAATWAPLNNGIDDPIKIVQMREGQTLSETFRSDGEPFQVFEIPVPVSFSIAQDSPAVSVDSILWPEVELLTYDQTDQVEIEYGLAPPRVIFGDGIAGNIPTQDAEIAVAYFVTSGTLGSIASDTMGAFDDPIIAGSTVISTTISNTSPSTPGSDPESLNSIKINAPRVYQAAQRSVTALDLAGWVNSYVDPVYGAVARGTATSPRSAVADAEGQSIIAMMGALGVPTSLTTRLSNYLDSVLSSNCAANVVNAQILSSDSIGRYVPAPAGLAISLAAFLNTIAESTVEAVVTDGSINLLSVDAFIGISIDVTITNDELRTSIVDAARDAVQTLLLNRDFGESLRIGDIYQTVEGVGGVDYSNISLVVRNNIGDDISSSRLDQFGDLEIELFEVITMGATPSVEIL
jgi:hypothetical protein